jgi:DnaK suppressor protein
MAAKKAKSEARSARAAAQAPVQAPAPAPDTPIEEVELPAGYQPALDEPYMSPQQLAYFRRKLLDWRDALLRESQQTIDHLRSDGASRYVGDEADRARDESEVALELRTRDRYRKLLPKIEAALHRIDDGTYGYCEETGEPIGLKRLEARPIATLSVEAQELRERSQRGYRDDA